MRLRGGRGFIGAFLKAHDESRAQTALFFLIRGGMKRRRRHDECVFVVVGIIRLAHTDLFKIVFYIQLLRAQIGHAHFERRHVRAAARGVLERKRQQQFAQRRPR